MACAERAHLAVFVSGFGTGGVPRVMMTLAAAFAARGERVDLVVACAEGPTRASLPPKLRLVDLARWRRLPFPARGGSSRRALAGIPALARYLRRERPEVLISGGTYPNLAAVAGRALAGTSVPLVVTHHANLSVELTGKRLAPWVARHAYPRADAVVAVSHGVAEDLAHASGLPPRRIATIHNPVVPPGLAELAHAPLDHPWFRSGTPPVVLGVGRLHRQKDFPTLVRAFARMRRSRELRLVILGVGRKAERERELLALASELGVADDVDLVGFVANPFAYMARAGVFVLSSIWEGLPTALIEAMACGCPVVSTDCPNGPAEILAEGKYGPLTPSGDSDALARAALAVLDAPLDAAELRGRADEFSVDAAAERYLSLLRAVRAGASTLD